MRKALGQRFQDQNHDSSQPSTLEICHQSRPMQHNYNLYAYYALFRRGSRIWRWHSDGESEEVDEASDADRDGGIAEAICSTMCTNLCHHVLPKMISSFFADVVLCTASLSCFQSNVPTWLSLVSFDHWRDEPVWAGESQVSFTFQRADLFPAQPYKDSKNGIVETEPLLQGAFLDPHGQT